MNPMLKPVMKNKFPKSGAAPMLFAALALVLAGCSSTTFR